MRRHHSIRIAILILLLNLIFTPMTAAQGVVINEVMTSNVRTILDEEGSSSDWIEIYNGSDAAVNLAGWGLSDDPQDPDKWTFPEFMVPAKDFALVFASDKDKLGFIGPIPVLHTNYKLNAKGETVVLSNPAGEVIDTVATGSLPEDISIGRQPSGQGEWKFFDHPTPREKNVNFSYSGFAPEAVFSHAAGFYSANFNLSISATTGQIFYTLDGSEPTPASSIYTGPLTIDATQVVRARVFGPELMPSTIKTRNYILKRTANGLGVVTLTTDPQHLWNTQNGLFNSLDTLNFLRQGTWPDFEKPVYIELYEPDGTQAFSLNAGLQLAGNFSRIYPQKSFALFARNQLGPKDIDYPIFPDLPFNTYESFILRNAGNDWASTTFRDALMHTLVKDTGLDHQAYRPVSVVLNGQYWGKYNLREKINEHYLAAHHGVDPNNLDLLEGPCFFDQEFSVLRCDPAVLQGDTRHFAGVVNDFMTADLRQPQAYARAQEVLDIPDLIKYFAAEIYSANQDWPFNNIKIWRPRTTDGKWRWLLFDTDYAFGRSSQAGWDNDTFAAAIKYNIFFTELLKNNAFRQEFITTLNDYLNTIFSPAKVIETVNDFAQTLAPEMPGHIERWKNMGDCPFLQLTEFPLEERDQACRDNWVALDSMQKWEWEVDVLRQFAQLRPDFLRNRMIQRFGLSGQKTQLQILVSPGQGGEVRLNNHVNVQGGFSGTFFRDFPVQLTAVPAQGYHFTGWTGALSGPLRVASLTLTGGAMSVTATFSNGPVQFQRGDMDSNGTVNLTDAVIGLNHLFRDGPGPVCQDILDANDDGQMDISDPITILFALFANNGVTIAAPYPGFGADPTADSLVCHP